MSRPEVPAGTVVLMYEGWQVWDGQYWPVRVGGELVASVEFVQRSTPTSVEPDSSPRVEHIEGNRYRAIARVLDATDAVVLDLGALRALRWIRPGETAGDFSTGDLVSVDLSLSLNGWPTSSWTHRAAELHGTDHRWHVERIVYVTGNPGDAVDLEEASMTTVDADDEHCLLFCTLVDAEPEH
ncbi:hypothetical protein [Nocardioides stalactiti]|uniref:hypothetical protein n=1 Tax=Nocardioides stalactiti TaxID=2755356 RepID=UPI0015FEC3AE|nr:hypothetical protein [Nocardioides stalactiti]